MSIHESHDCALRSLTCSKLSNGFKSQVFSITLNLLHKSKSSFLCKLISDLIFSNFHHYLAQSSTHLLSFSRSQFIFNLMTHLLLKYQFTSTFVAHHSTFTRLALYVRVSEKTSILCFTGAIYTVLFNVM